jgi:hypothetical protein
MVTKYKEIIMGNDKVFTIAVLIAFLTLVGSLAYNQNAELKSMERNIESAIVKGIDPVAVRCAYKADSTMCAIYATKAK